MNIEIKVPPMGESISEATLGMILKPTGSLVLVDEEIVELETDKVNQVLFAPEKGVLTLLVQTGQTVKVGEVIGFIETGVEAKAKEEPPSSFENMLENMPEKEKKEAISSLDVTKPTFFQETIRFTKEQFIQKLLKEEPLKEKQPPSTFLKEEPSVHRKKMSTLRKVIAKRLVEAQKEAAMLTTFNEVDLSHVMAAREKYKEKFLKAHGVKLGLMSFFVKACVSALKKIPEMNAYLEKEEIVYHESCDIGIAVGTDKGVIVPVVRGCERLSFAGIEKAILGFALKSKQGGLLVSDLQGGTFTITNGGVFGSLLSTPILNPPQSGILGMHKIQKRPVVVDDKIVILPMMYLALSYDHRIIDGKEAVSFLVHVKQCLEDPLFMDLEL